jgi:enoyl-CoA hydratase/carnithine racemase
MSSMSSEYNMTSPDTPSGGDAFQITTPATGVALIRIVARPHGVLTVAARRRLKAALDDLAAQRATRCIVLTGDGRAFSAGSNIREFEATVEWVEGARLVEVALNETIANSPVPVIAACNGATLGGGAVMALACDVRISAASATFGFPEVKLGAMAGATGTQSLPRLVGPGQALRLMLTGRVIGADEAWRIGLVDEVVPDEELLPHAIRVAAEIAGVSREAVRATKRCVRGGLTDGYAAGMQLEAAVTAPLGLTGDAIEGKAAFIEKRPPRFE